MGVLEWVLLSVAIIVVAILMFNILRWTMLQLLFGPGFDDLTRVTAGALGPTIRALPFDRPQLQSVVQDVAALLQGETVVFAPLGDYAATEVQDMVEGLAGLLGLVVAHYAITVPNADLGRLLDAVAERALLTPATPTS